MKRTACLMFVVFVAGGLAVAQTMQDQHPMMPAGEKPGMMMDCQAMMAKNQEMETRMAEMDARLQQLVDQMNTARGSAKVDRVAAVVTELVTQRKQMREQMMTMQPMMMQHMHHGMMKGMGEGMAGCPMMKKDSM